MRSAFIVFAILFAPGLVDSCGPFFDTAGFAPARGPLPEQLDKGQIGVLQSQFRTADLLVAYRILSGVPLSQGETPRPMESGDDPPNRAAEWLDARSLVPGATPVRDLKIDKEVPGQNYQTFQNCLDDAFVKATATLRQRAAKWGSSDARLREWLTGQDTVFCNCSKDEASIPPVLPAGDPLLLADRRYQIAAAEFYAGQYVKSEAAFDAIAQDRSSPWRSIASYLAARACIRQFTIGHSKEKLVEAASRLGDLNDNAARNLLPFVQAQLDPAVRLEDLSRDLLKPNQGGSLQRVLTDYTHIERHMLEAGQMPPSGRSDVMDWIEAIRFNRPALTAWRSRPTIPWLIAALKDSDPNADIHDLIQAAHSIIPASPGYPSVAYWGIRLEILAHHYDAARDWADEALKHSEPDDVTNYLRSERFNLARNWNDFLRFAPRVPVVHGDGSDTFEEPVEGQGRDPEFDWDAAQPLNTAVPLALWLDASRNPLLPPRLQVKVARSGWVRAVILNDRAAADGFADRLVALQSPLARDMRGYLTERDEASARFYAVFLMLRAPGLAPDVRVAWGRPESVQNRSAYRDNWWAVDRRQVGAPLLQARYTDFLSDEQLTTGAAEDARIIDRAPNGVNYLCAETIAWAESHPSDSRVPEALHLAVEATRVGPVNAASQPLCRSALLNFSTESMQAPGGPQRRHTGSESRSL